MNEVAFCLSKLLARGSALMRCWLARFLVLLRRQLSAAIRGPIALFLLHLRLLMKQLAFLKAPAMFANTVRQPVRHWRGARLGFSLHDREWGGIPAPSLAT